MKSIEKNLFTWLYEGVATLLLLHDVELYLYTFSVYIQVGLRIPEQRRQLQQQQK